MSHATLDSESIGSLECFQLLTYDFYCTSFSPALQTFLGILFALFLLNSKKIDFYTGSRREFVIPLWILSLEGL